MKGSTVAEVEPETEWQWLIDDVRECGIAQSMGFGIVPTPWTEIRAWMQSTGVVGWWHAKVIRRLSEAYCEQLNLAKSPSCPAPLSGGTDDNREVVADQFSKLVNGRNKDG